MQGTAFPEYGNPKIMKCLSSTNYRGLLHTRGPLQSSADGPSMLPQGIRDQQWRRAEPDPYAQTHCYVASRRLEYPKKTYSQG